MPVYPMQTPASLPGAREALPTLAFKTEVALPRLSSRFFVFLFLFVVILDEIGRNVEPFPVAREELVLGVEKSTVRFLGHVVPDFAVARSQFFQVREQCLRFLWTPLHLYPDHPALQPKFSIGQMGETLPFAQPSPCPQRPFTFPMAFGTVRFELETHFVDRKQVFQAP